MSFVWVDQKVVFAIHEAQLAEHGGLVGARDVGLLESALAKPANRAAYGTPDLAECAAAYGFGIASNHPFIDGNKRTAFVCLELFLELNGVELKADDHECVRIMLAVAAGRCSEAALAQWVRQFT